MNNETPQPAFVGLSDEIRAYWSNLPDKAWFFALAVAWFAIFHFWGSSSFGYIPSNSLFTFMEVAYRENKITDDTHGTFIPLVVLGILWWKRDDLFKKPLQPWWPGLLLIACGLLSHVVGYVIQQQRLSIIGLFVGLYGITGLVWGWNWLKATFFPFFLFGFMVPVGSLIETVTFPLRLAVTWVVSHIFNDLLGIGVVRVGTQLFNHMSNYQYDVAAACGGMRSLIAISLISISYGFLVFRSPWKRLVMVAASLPLAVIGNVVRLSAIVGAGEFGGQALGNTVHDSTIISILPYIPAIFGVMQIGKFLEKMEAPQAANENLIVPKSLA